LLPLDAYIIPQKRAPQLRAPKMSPSVQLGADVITQFEVCFTRQTTIKSNRLLTMLLCVALKMFIFIV
jgi:hypothetical protein